MDNKIFNITETNESVVKFHIELPTGNTMEEINTKAKREITDLINEQVTFGKDVMIEGRITTALSMLIGHEFSHVSHSISLFDPKENKYILIIKH